MRNFRQNEPLLKVITAPIMNEISEAVNHVNATKQTSMRGDGKMSLPAGVVLVNSTSTKAIPAFTPVTITGAQILPERDFTASEAVRNVSFTVLEYTENDEQDWGVLLEQLPPGGQARMFYFGVTMMPIRVTDETHEYAIPKAEEIVSTSEVTKAKIVFLAASEREDGRHWGVVRVDGGNGEFVYPQWGVSVEHQENEDVKIIVNAGTVILQYIEEGTEGEGAGSGVAASKALVMECLEADLGVQNKSGVVVWVSRDLHTAGTIEFVEGDVVAEDDWIAWVPLANVVFDGGKFVSIAQKQIDSIFISELPYVLASEEKTIRLPDKDGKFKTYKIIVDPLSEGGKKTFVIGIAEVDENGDPVESEKPPPCGHPGNGGAAGGDEDHPGDGENEPDENDPTDGHPGNGDGDDGATPESGGDCDEDDGAPAPDPTPEHE